MRSKNDGPPLFESFAPFAVRIWRHWALVRPVLFFCFFLRPFLRSLRVRSFLFLACCKVANNSAQPGGVGVRMVLRARADGWPRSWLRERVPLTPGGTALRPIEEAAANYRAGWAQRPPHVSLILAWIADNDEDSR